MIDENNNYKKEIGDKLEDFIILQILHKGEYGYVAKVKSKKNNKIYTMKKYNNTGDKLKRRLFRNEEILLKKLDNENICKCYFYLSVENDVYLIMEYMDNGSLLDLLNSKCEANKNIEIYKLYNIFLQCLKGLEYIHSLGLIHRDIKPVHFVLDSYGRVKLIDFKVACLLNKEQATKFTNDETEKNDLLDKNEIKYGAGDFMAPEIKKDYYDNKIDVYSLGITFCCLISFNTSLDNSKKNEDNKDLYEIIEKMIEKDRTKRSSVSEILEDLKEKYINKYTYFTGINSALNCLGSFEYINYNDILSQFINEIKNWKLFLYETREILSNNLIKKYKRNTKEIDPIYVIDFLLKQMHKVYKNKNNNKTIISENFFFKTKNICSMCNNQYIKDFYFIPFNVKVIREKIETMFKEKIKKIEKEKIEKIEKEKEKMEKEKNEKIEKIEKEKTEKEKIETEKITTKFKEKIEKIEKEKEKKEKEKIETIFKEKIEKEKIEKNEQFNLSVIFEFFFSDIMNMVEKNFCYCSQCQKITEHQLDIFYPKCLIIYFERGQKWQYRNFINFEEKLSFKNNKTDIQYTLCSIICRIEKYDSCINKKRIGEYIFFIKQGENNYLENNNNKIQLNEIKNKGDIEILFYNKQDNNNNNNSNINNNINVNNNNINNQSNNIMNNQVNNNKIIRLINQMINEMNNNKNIINDLEKDNFDQINNNYIKF